MRISVDDGCASDVRIADLLTKYEIPGIFYFPVEWNSLAKFKRYKPLTFQEAYSISKNFEIGSHTITHPHLTAIEEEEAKTEISESKYYLQQLFDQPINKFCPPRGYTNDRLTKFTLEYYDEQRLTKGEGLVHIHPNSGANENQPWRSRIDEDTTELWCHSWELDLFNLWEELEDFLREYSSR